MDKNILNRKNRDYAERIFNEVINLGIEFKLKDEVVLKKVDFEKIQNQLCQLPEKGKSMDDIIKEIKDDILPYCTNFSSNNFMGFPDAGNSIAGISGALLTDFLQQNLINSSFCAPIGTYIEIALIQWLRRIVGYRNKKNIKNIWDVGGIITYGGTGSNAIAMLLARENHKENTMKEGIKKPEEFKVIIPKGIGHYSIKSSLMWIGCGDNVLEVPTQNYKYDLTELEKTIRENAGKVMAVVAYVGDSRSMTIDNLEKVADIVKKYDENIWLHADACHGFSLGFSEKLKEKIKGIEKFDSISTDPHKVLMTPYTVSALLLKNSENLKLITTTSDLIMQEPFAFGQVTAFIGSKSWISFKVWCVIKNIGVKNIGKIIEKRHEMAKEFAKKLIKNGFIVLNDVDINSVMFMYAPSGYSVDKINEINRTIKRIMDEEGKFFLHQFSINDDNGRIKQGETLYPLRYMSGNDNITEENQDDLIGYIKNIIKNRR